MKRRNKTERERERERERDNTSKGLTTTATTTTAVSNRPSLPVPTRLEEGKERRKKQNCQKIA
jgi:hypothetical protein